MRVYAKDQYCTTEDQWFIRALKVLEVKRVSEGDTEVYRKNYKHACNVARESIGVTDLCCLALNKEETHVAIFMFPIQATNDNFYDLKVDEEKNQFYIETEEGVLIND